MKSVLQLNEYFFPSFGCSANKEFDPAKRQLRFVDIPVESVKLKLTGGADKTVPDLYTVMLTIVIEPDKNKDIPYYIYLEAFGTVIIDNDFGDNKESVAVLNGASLLFSAAREFILAMTSRGPLPPLKLPTVTFGKFTKDEIEAPKKALSKKKE